MRYPAAVKGILNATMPGPDNIRWNGADKGVERIRVDRINNALTHLLRINTRRCELFS